jgi:hypothetical protein
MLLLHFGTSCRIFPFHRSFSNAHNRPIAIRRYLRHFLVFLFLIAKYKIDNSLERNYKYELLPDVNVGVSLDLIDLSAWAVPRDVPPLDPADQKLIAGIKSLSLYFNLCCD